jgi:predicted transcriptional regulator
MCQTEREPGVEDIPLDALADVLTSEQRRRLIGALASRQESRISVEELAAELDASDDAGSTATELVHNHLPRLDERNIVEFDGDTVRCRRATDLDAWLDEVRVATGEKRPERDR